MSVIAIPPVTRLDYSRIAPSRRTFEKFAPARKANLCIEQESLFVETGPTQMLESLGKRDGEIWLDGKYVAWADATLHVLSHGLHYASSVFEGARAYDGRVFKLEEHSARLMRSAAILEIELPYASEDVVSATRELIARSGLQSAYVRTIVWRGPESLAINGQGVQTHVAIAAWPWGNLFADRARERGLRLGWSRWRRPNPESAPHEAKAAGVYAVGTLAKRAADREGYDDALMLDYRGLVAEATGANIFLIRDGALHTPIPDCFLNGITRQTVIELARHRGIPVHERFIRPEELVEFEAAFLTGSAAEIAPVSSIGAVEYRSSLLTEQLANHYRNLVCRADGR